MKPIPTLEDLIGIEYAKLGFFREVQEKIAELNATNIELSRKQRHIQAILDSITDVMAVLSPRLRISSVNRAFHEVFSESQPEGQTCYQVFRNADRPCFPCPALKAFEKNQVFRETVIYPVDGKNRHFEITASPLRSEGGRPCHILLLKRDVTLEQEYRAKYHQAERMATVGVLAAGVAHEINNPLTAIIGFAEGLKRRIHRLPGNTEPAIVEDFNEYIAIIMKECDRCREIVRGLLTFSREGSSEFSQVCLNKLISDTLKLLKNHLRHCARDIIRLDLDDTLPQVRGDESQLKQVILNLLFNALDATQEKGTITLRTFVNEEDRVCLSLEDSGCGIPPANLDKLFEPFFTTKPVGKGVGIGLSTCYNIVRKHGGEIIVQSREGFGSTFQVILPREDLP
ncbi:MAG: PAS domain-containing protein [Deltaproteobacteria bacterium]|nr:PAS domain-containing protein [Deltaproteobacteria bacterium]